MNTQHTVPSKCSTSYTQLVSDTIHLGTTSVDTYRDLFRRMSIQMYTDVSIKVLAPKKTDTKIDDDDEEEEDKSKKVTIDI